MSGPALRRATAEVDARPGVGLEISEDAALTEAPAGSCGEVKWGMSGG